jgi:D-alanine-D-alanine ligase
VKVTVLIFRDSADESDAVAEQVRGALEAHGHDARILEIEDDLRRLVTKLEQEPPDAVFNLVETFAGKDVLGDVGVAGVLELLDIPYTGTKVGDLYLSQDKSLAKKLLAFEGLRTPDFAVFHPDDDFETAGRLKYPMFVKPLRSDASIGIDAGSLVVTTPELLERVALIHRELGDAALAEEFVDGREFHVGVLGNVRATAFPPVEIDFSGMPEGAPKVLDSKAKWDTDSPEFKGSVAKIAELDDELRARLQETAVAACRAVRVRGYGRADLRLTAAGDLHVIEVNANPYLEKGAEFAMGAQAAGKPHDVVIREILDLAMARPKRRQPRPAAATG